MKAIGLALLVGSVLLSACGARPDPDSGTASSGVVYGPDGQVISGAPDLGAAVDDVVTVRAITDANSIETGGTGVATITALITDEDNRAVAGQAVSFSSTGGVLQNISSETDENGEASAQLTLARDYQNQDIRVSVVAGTATGTVLIRAAGSSIDMAGPGSLVLGDSAELTLTLTAGNGEPIANEAVTFSSSANNTLSPISGSTDADGRVVLIVDSAAGSDTITASALNGTVIGLHQFTVAQDILSFRQPNKGAEFPVGTVNTVEVEWRSEGLPVVGQNLRFGITAGQIISSSLVTTDAAGRAAIQVTSSSAGPATVSVASDADGDPATQIGFEFVATTPSNVSVSISSSRVATNDTSTITALVVDSNGNPVKNREVEFSSADLKGGQLNPASAVTNSAGEASVTFTAGSLATEFEEVRITAEVNGTNISSSASLTVVERVLNITLGTSGLLESIAAETQYGLPFAVQVADGSGTPLANATVELSIEPTEYFKGRYIVVEDVNGSEEWYQSISATCDAEDQNGNRILDAGEDVNGNGTLDPQDPAVIAAHTSNIPTVEGGAISTDSNGSGYFTLVYPASSSRWSEVNITARAKALGVEAEETFHALLYVLATRLDDVDVVPPNHVSPYGVSTSCSDEL